MDIYTLEIIIPRNGGIVKIGTGVSFIQWLNTPNICAQVCAKFYIKSM